jgi:hypothetical protein
MADLAQPGDAATPAGTPTTPDIQTVDPGPLDTSMSPDQAWDVVKQFESDGRNVPNYMYDPTGANSPDRLPHTAGGYGQITDQNWKKYGPQVGVDLSQYPNAMSAPEDVQKKVFTAMYQKEGWAPWAPYNQRLRDYLSGRGVNTQGGRNPYWQRDIQAGTDFDAVIAASQMSPEERAAYDRVEKAFEEETGAAKEARQREAAFAEEMAGKLKAESPQLLEWANSMPSRQAMYGASMQMAPMLAIFTALGGRATHLTGLQLLSAQTGIVQGLNEGAKDKYNAAMEQWKMGWEALQAHQRMENEYYRLMLDAYGGRADAEEKAAFAAEKMMGNMRTEEQRRQTTAIQAYRARQAAVLQAERLNYLYANLDERIKRDRDYHDRVTALDNALLQTKLDPNAKYQYDMFKRYLDDDERRINESLRQMQQIRQDPSLDPENRAMQLQQLQTDINGIEDQREYHLAAMRNIVMGGMTRPQGAGAAGAPQGGAGPAVPQGQGAAPPVPVQMGPGGAPAAPQGEDDADALPTLDPTDPTRRKTQVPNPNKPGTMMWVYTSDDGRNWRPLSPQEQARIKPPQPASPAVTPSMTEALGAM